MFCVLVQRRSNGGKPSAGFVVYTFAHADDNSDGAFFLAVSPRQPDAEWGPASNDARHRIGGNFSQPFFRRRISVSTYWQFSSATPYIVATGNDANGVGIFNERPAGFGRNGSRGFAQFYQGAHVGWNLLRGVAPPGTQPKRRMQIWLEADNLWNRVNRTVVSGVQTSPDGATRPLTAGGHVRPHTSVAHEGPTRLGS